MYSTISYILSVLKRGGNIIVTNCIKLYDENGNFVCCLSDADLEAVRKNIKEESL